MLYRKMLREIKSSFGQFFSIFMLAVLAMAMYATFAGEVEGFHQARERFHDASNLGDVWIYGEEITNEMAEEVKALDFVSDVQLRTGVTCKATKYDDAQVELYLEDENVVSKPYLIEGEEFNPEDTEGVWISNAFAKRRDVRIGDEFTFEYKGFTITKVVKGLIETPEHEYRQADGDADVYLENIVIVYMSFDAEMNIPYTQLVVRTNDGQALEHEKEIAEALNYDYAAMVDCESIDGIARLDSEIEQHKMFSYVFMIVFVGIAVLVIATTMNRMIEKQRMQIGTMNALGMKNRKIFFHYISFSLFVTMVGVILGMVIGYSLLCPFLVDTFANYYVVPGLAPGVDAGAIYIALLIVAVCASVAFLSCRSVLGIKPAQALRPKPPKQGKRILFERLPFWNRLSFGTQYNLRDISRAKLRAFMGVAGTAIGMLLAIYGIGCNLLVSQIHDDIFEKVQNYQYSINLTEDITEDEAVKVRNEVDGELMMMDQIEVSDVEKPVSSEKKKGYITVIEGKGLYNILDVNNNVATLDKGQVGLSRKMAEDLGLSIGDTFYWHMYSENTWYKAKVGTIYRSTETQGIVYLKSDFDELECNYTASQVFTNQEVSDYEDNPLVTGIVDQKDSEEAFYHSYEVVNIMVWMMIILSALMTIVVLYNSGNLSFNERIKEFATLKVVGFQTPQIRSLLSRQNLCLSIIGVVIGAPFGKATLNAMMNSNGDNFDYSIMLTPSTYIASGAFVLLVSVLVGFMFSKRIKRLDMVEVLKAVD